MLPSGRRARSRVRRTGALKDFEVRRHRSRLSLIGAHLAEGQSIGDIGRAWGFSRQLASAYAREARAMEAGRHGPSPTPR